MLKEVQDETRVLISPKYFTLSTHLDLLLPASLQRALTIGPADKPAKMPYSVCPYDAIFPPAIGALGHVPAGVVAFS